MLGFVRASNLSLVIMGVHLYLPLLRNMMVARLSWCFSLPWKVSTTYGNHI